jgi:hypothetical protein
MVRVKRRRKAVREREKKTTYHNIPGLAKELVQITANRSSNVLLGVGVLQGGDDDALDLSLGRRILQTKRIM